MTTEARLGSALRELRRRLGLTLEQVERKTGITASTLSKVERGRLSLTYEKLVQLSQGLDVDITVFFDGKAGASTPGAGSTRRSVNHDLDGKVIETRNYRNVYLSTDLLQKRVVPILTDVKARSMEEFGDFIRHSGEEFTFVVRGTVAIYTEHYERTLLKAGESIYFDSDMGHAYIAVSEGPCQILSICTAPESALLDMNREALASEQPAGAVDAKPARGRSKPATETAKTKGTGTERRRRPR